MVTRTINVYDNDSMVVAAGSPSLTPGSTIINNSDTPNGTIFQFTGGMPVTVSLNDTGGSANVFEDDNYTRHRIIDGALLVAAGTGVEAESLIYLRALDQFGNQTGPTITLVMFSRNNVTSNVWGFHSDRQLYAGTTYVKTSGNNIGSISYAAIQNPPVCFASGTLIDTPDGPRPVETLEPGDPVTTLDHGPRPIRWVHSGLHHLDSLEREARPVLIAAGALGPDHPSRDLIVSPQHRILVGGHRQLHDRFEREAFAPAKALTSLPGIRNMMGRKRLTWVHFAFDRHEIVRANGCLSESLLLGAMVVNGLPAAERRALHDIFGPVPAPGASLNGPPARECLAVGAVRSQLAAPRGMRTHSPGRSSALRHC